jgi:hypothetical protein
MVKYLSKIIVFGNIHAIIKYITSWVFHCIARPEMHLQLYMRKTPGGPIKVSLVLRGACPLLVSNSRIPKTQICILLGSRGTCGNIYLLVGIKYVVYSFRSIVHCKHGYHQLFKQLYLSAPTTFESSVLRQKVYFEILLGLVYHCLMLHALHDVVIPWVFV